MYPGPQECECPYSTFLLQAAEYKNSRSLFDGKAREHTRLHASAQAIGGKGEARGRESASAGEPVEEKEDEPPAKLVRRESAAAAPS